MYKLFIDDIRNPTTSDWIVARSSAGALRTVQRFGMPHTISFDHDLGEEDTTINFLNWMEKRLLDGTYVFPKDFKYFVHSANPVGAANIHSKISQYLRYFKEN